MPQHQKKAKRYKSPDDRPARKRYWNRKSLERNKSRRVARNTGLPIDEATNLWKASRGIARMR